MTDLVPVAPPEAASDGGDTWPYTFEGIQVDRAALTIRMGNIIEQTMAVDPARWHKGDEVTFVVSTTMVDVNHKSRKDDDAWTRQHVAKALVITPVDDDLVGGLLAAQAKRIEEAKGIQELPYGGADEDPADEPGDDSP